MADELDGRQFLVFTVPFFIDLKTPHAVRAENDVTNGSRLVL